MSIVIADIREIILQRVKTAPLRELLALSSAEAAAPSVVEPRFEIIDEDLARDRITGLVWTRGFVPGGKRPWKESMAAASAFTSNGWTFRAPTIAERLGINDYSRHNPAIDTDIFKSEASGWEWTSTDYNPSPSDYAWRVYFSDGDSSYGSRGGNGWVRAVRVGQF